MSGDARPVATASQTIGPFFHFGLPPKAMTTAPGLVGEPIRLVVRVTDGDGRPVSDALVELAHAGTFGRMPTGEDGSCEFDTVRPGSGTDGDPGRHLSVCLFARGLLRHLHTRIYFAVDPGDEVLALVPEERRGTLLAEPDREVAGRWVFPLRLQGPQETVFFNV